MSAIFESLGHTSFGRGIYRAPTVVLHLLVTQPLNSNPFTGRGRGSETKCIVSPIAKRFTNAADSVPSDGQAERRVPELGWA